MTSFTELARDGQDCERWNMLHPLETPRVPYIAQVMNDEMCIRDRFTRDVDYIVKDGEVIIVDEHTGRTMQGRRWSDGLHQAVEAKEGCLLYTSSTHGRRGRKHLQRAARSHQQAGASNAVWPGRQRQ